MKTSNLQTFEPSNFRTFKLSNLLLAAALSAFAPAGAFADKAYVSVKVYDGQEDRGKVSGGNAYFEAGKTITIKATPNKGYGFAVPSGVKAAEDPDPTKNGSVVFTGAPTKPGAYTIDFAKTYVDKNVYKSRIPVIVKDPGSFYISVDVGDNPDSAMFYKAAGN